MPVANFSSESLASQDQLRHPSLPTQTPRRAVREQGAGIAPLRKIL